MQVANVKTHTELQFVAMSYHELINLSDVPTVPLYL